MFYRNYVHKNNLLGVGVLAFIAGIATWALVGKRVTSELNKNPEFRDLKKQVYKKASEISDLTREKYDALVEEVSQNYAKMKGISENELVNLVDDLKMHWGKIKGAW